MVRWERKSLLCLALGVLVGCGGTPEQKADPVGTKPPTGVRSAGSTCDGLAYEVHTIGGRRFMRVEIDRAQMVNDRFALLVEVGVAWPEVTTALLPPTAGSGGKPITQSCDCRKVTCNPGCIDGMQPSPYTPVDCVLANPPAVPSPGGATAPAEIPPPGSGRATKATGPAQPAPKPITAKPIDGAGVPHNAAETSPASRTKP